jgi:phenylacetate-CoA ligase
MYAWLVPNVVLPAYETLSGHRASTEMRRLRELQWRPPEELEARALQKLRRVLAHAVAHVPYYRELWGEGGVRPENVRAARSGPGAFPGTIRRAW